MSTLTKVLIILQVFGVLALCVLVVSYVASADNYKQRYEQQQQKATRATQQQQATVDDYERFKAAKEQEIANLNRENTRLKTQVTMLENQLTEANRLNGQLNDKITSLAAQIEVANRLTAEQTAIAKKAQQDIEVLRDKLANTEAQLDQANDSLNEKIAVIEIQTKQIKALAQEKDALYAKLEQTVRQYGKTVVPPLTRPATGTAQPAVQPTATRDIRGAVTRVDLDKQLVEVSIGSSAGVKEQMKLMVARGDRFVCNIQVLAVDADRAVGVLDMVQLPPQVGDVVTLGL